MSRTRTIALIALLAAIVAVSPSAAAAPGPGSASATATAVDAQCLRVTRSLARTTVRIALMRRVARNATAAGRRRAAIRQVRVLRTRRAALRRASARLCRPAPAPAVPPVGAAPPPAPAAATPGPPVVPVAGGPATVLEGRGDDPLGDSVILANPEGQGWRAMDLSGASVRYDAGLGEIRVTYTGLLPVNAHQGTRFTGTISTGPCGSAATSQDLGFSAATFSGSGGGVRMGTARLERGLTFDGAVVFPDERTVVIVFSGSVLAGRAYGCATDLQATWTDSQNVSNVDGVAAFAIGPAS